MTGSFNPLKQSEITHDMYNKDDTRYIWSTSQKRVQIQALYKAE